MVFVKFSDIQDQKRTEIGQKLKEANCNDTEDEKSRFSGGKEFDDGVHFYPIAVRSNAKNIHIIHSKICICWVKMDAITKFLATENIEDENSCYD